MIRCDSIYFSAGDFHMQDVSFTIAKGTYAVLTGENGAGKTTLLEILCGLQTPLRGSVWIDHQEMTFAAPGIRGIGYVPQDSVLFPMMTVRDHLVFPLKIHAWPSEKITSRVNELSNLLNLSHLLERLPNGLSGGERQRTALGRALAFMPKVLLMDEPFAALDNASHKEFSTLIQRIHQEYALTVLHVTHQEKEVHQLAQQILKMEHGSISASHP
jgi:molybdate/tungstate transport system ATP-binding protein